VAVSAERSTKTIVVCEDHLMPGCRSFIGGLLPYFYIPKAVPGPGSENLAFTNEGLPCFTPIGPGIANVKQFWFLTPAPSASHLIGVSGIGGLLAEPYGGTGLTAGHING
jgi:hypothetical protein